MILHVALKITAEDKNLRFISANFRKQFIGLLLLQNRRKLCIPEKSIFIVLYCIYNINNINKNNISYDIEYGFPFILF